MALNKCIFNDEGREAVISALEKLEINPDNMKGLSEKMSLDEICIDRITLGKMLKYSQKPKTLQFRSIQTLFNWINKKLEDKNLGCCPLLDSYYQEVTETNNPKVSSSRSQSTPSPGSPDRVITDLLWKLNCRQQEANFGNSLQYLQPAGTFLVRAKDLNLQKYLVKRLARDIPGFQNAYCQPLVVPPHPMRINFEEFWRELATKFKTEPTRNSIIKAISDRCKSQTVILALYNIHTLDDAKLLDLSDFWSELVENVRSQPRRSFRSYLVLFLTEEIGDKQYPFETVSNFDIKSPCNPLILPQLQGISQGDTTVWLKQDSVYQSLLNSLGEERIELLLRDISQCDPNDVPLNKICWGCGLKGVAEIEQYWEL
ncbi:MAG: hypothetical protein SAJ37_08965 [Oscillatoria sp. PMC 1068.18]|nr:hypothetical protein [Oscillatoria sp. PMC 1076.18]MEC4988864.1 hypothetical protein [Oscillatoria sp. PMC 1068.18]